jgi:hypothetical protein
METNRRDVDGQDFKLQHVRMSHGIDKSAWPPSERQNKIDAVKARLVFFTTRSKGA